MKKIVLIPGIPPFYFTLQIVEDLTWGGFVVRCLDVKGATGYSMTFEGAIKHGILAIKEVRRAQTLRKFSTTLN